MPQPRARGKTSGFYIHTYQLADLVRQPAEPLLCPHDPGIKKALLAAAASGSVPDHVVLYGVVPEWKATGVTLSRAVRSSIAPVVGLIVAELQRHGAAPTQRTVPRVPDTWWERNVEAHATAVAAGQARDIPLARGLLRARPRTVPGTRRPPARNSP